MKRRQGVLVLLAVHRLAFLGLCGLVTVLAPWYEERRHADWVLALWETGDSFWGHFYTWDGQAYLTLARDGYLPGDQLCAFYPLWPSLLKLAAPLFGGSAALTGLVLANLFAWIGSALFYRLVERRWGRDLARDSLWLWLALPGTLFLGFPYTEGLFFLLLMVFWTGMEDERPGPAAIAGFLLPMTRAVGVFVLLPLAWHLGTGALRSWRGTGAGWTRLPAHLCRQPLAVVSIAVVAGYTTYFTLMALWTGNPFEGFAAQRHYANQPSVENIVNLPGFATAFADIGQLHGPTDSVLDRLLFVLLLLGLAPMWRLDPRCFWWGLGAGVIPALSNWLLSYQRFVPMVFPLPVVLALWCRRRGSRIWFYYYLGLELLLQAWFLVRHMNLFWVA
ncbi:MAG: hypothetical protein H7A45_13335 [Verrucomicrobiales bacterium]|nr:hypothetical protein [Verrucomicrobiales bacterium]MCP5528319.1 hypothetical protein [Verrucomicrobiales bacterium]